VAIRERPDGRLQAIVTVRIDGRMRQFTRLAPKGAGVRQARQLEDQIRAEVVELRRRHVPAERSSTVLDLLERHLELLADTIRESSKAEYRRRVDRWIRPHPIAKIRLDRLTAQHIDEHYARLRAAGLGPRSIQSVHALLDAALKSALRWDLITRNPAAGASIPRRPPQTITVPADDVVSAALTAAHQISAELGIFLHLLVITGARRGEILALRWTDIDLDAGTLTIERTVVPRADDQPPKNGHPRTVHLDAVTIELLAHHWAQTRALAGLFADPSPQQRWLFTGTAEGRTRRPYDWPSWQWTVLRDHVPALRTVRMHDLRHRAATNLIAAGIDATTAAGRLGHSPEVLLRTYAHPTDTKARAAADLLAAPTVAAGPAAGAARPTSG
jgi:integrase